MGVWTKPPVKTEPKPEAPVSSPPPVSPTGKQAAPPAAKPPPTKAPVRPSAATRAAPYQAQPSPPPTAKTAAPGAKARDDAADIVLRGASVDVPPEPSPTAATGFKAGTAPGTPERAAAIRAEQERVGIVRGDLEDARAGATTGELVEGRRVPEVIDEAEIRSLDREAKPVDKKSEFLGAAQRILAEQAHLDRLEADDKQGIVTAPAMLARKRTELAAKYPQAIQLNVPLLIPRTDGEGAHPTVKAFVAADEAGRIEMRRQLQELVGQRQAAFAGASDADRPQAAFEFLQVALLRDAIEDESRRQRGVK